MSTPDKVTTPPEPVHEKPVHTHTDSSREHHHFQHNHITEYVHLPRHHRHLPREIHPDGESNRSGFTFHFFRIILRSSCVPSAMVNILWPFVPAGIALHAIGLHGEVNHMAAFACNYLAIIPPANLLGFAGQELARKLPKVFGVLLETFLGGLVEIVLFMALIRDDSRDNIPVIQAAILGSILANLLFCMGLCFVAGGMRHVTQKFDGAITEVGCGLLFMAAFALAIPRSFAFSLDVSKIGEAEQHNRILTVSRACAIILLVAYVIFIGYQMFSHHGLYSSILEADEENDRDRDDDIAKDKLTLTECVVAIVIALTLVSVHAVFLVEEIDPITPKFGGPVPEEFLGLILVPLVEKFAEHLTAIDEAWDNTMNLALSHVLGATLQTALLNTSLVVLVGWGIGKEMNLDFSPFHVIIVVLAVLAAGTFLRDQESNYLEGALCVLIYALIAATAWYVPPEEGNFGDADAGNSTETASGAEASMTAEAAAAAVEHIVRMMART